MLARRARTLRSDAVRIRRDDFHLIGSVIGSLALPALLLRRVGLVNGLLGGVGLGGGIGLLTFYARDYVRHGDDSAAAKLGSNLNELRDDLKKDAKKLASD